MVVSLLSTAGLIWPLSKTTTKTTTSIRPKPKYNTHTKTTSGPINCLYDDLGLSYHASKADIKAAYRKLVRTCHPDVVSPDQRNKSADDFIRIHSAYATLSDPQKRADYDRKSQMSFSSKMTIRRTWETDQCW
ncbi:hypothetical protein AMTRI_Chr11g155830 [Amborella trichopoda]|uniref:J domain-containing protein n=1 Tax=Amborella trichopoda TaxID=13333 RepID=W1PFB7_AMBTC|nr:hypothetical protein AMTR_s00017p00209650 [Amborella trichopoda]